MQVERELDGGNIVWTLVAKRVSNTWVICLEVGDNLPKGELIPNVVF